MNHLFLILLTLILIPDIWAQNKILKAGAFQTEISPPIGAKIYGNWVQPSAVRIHDPLQAKALLLDDGFTRIAMVVVDLCETNQRIFDLAKKTASEKGGLKAENIMISSTHTHSGPDSYGDVYIAEGEPLSEYALFLAGRISDCIVSAFHNLEPAKIAWGGVDVPGHVFVRRWIMKDSVVSPYGAKEIVRMNPGFKNPALLKPSGPVDPEVSFISVQSLSGRPISVFANYSLHYVGGVPVGEISADYFGLFGLYLERMMTTEVFSPRFVGIMSNGTSGNVNNFDFSKEQENHAPYEKMNVVARDIAEKVYSEIHNLEHRTWVPLDARQEVVTLKVRRASPDDMANVARIQSRKESTAPYFSGSEKMFAHRIFTMESTWPKEIDAILQAFRIGDLGITALPFEAFTQTGLEIKSQSPFDDTFTIGLANGFLSYLPTPEEVEMGGYEAWLSINRVEKQASVIVTQKLLALMEELRD